MTSRNKVASGDQLGISMVIMEGDLVGENSMVAGLVVHKVDLEVNKAGSGGLSMDIMAGDLVGRENIMVEGSVDHRAVFGARVEIKVAVVLEDRVGRVVLVVLEGGGNFL